LTFNGLYGVISQKRQLFIITAVESLKSYKIDKNIKELNTISEDKASLNAVKRVGTILRKHLDKTATI
jgi:hypothetical protein